MPTTTNNNSNNENDGSNTDTNGSNSSNCNDESLPNLQHSIDDDANNNSNSSAIDFNNTIQQLFQNIQNETRQIFKAHEQRDTEEAIKFCAELHRNNNNTTNDDRKRRSSILDSISHGGGGGDDNNTPKRIKASPLVEAVVASTEVVTVTAADVSFENEVGETEEESSLNFGRSSTNDHYSMDFNESDVENNGNATNLLLLSGFTTGLALAKSKQDEDLDLTDEEVSIVHIIYQYVS